MRKFFYYFTTFLMLTSILTSCPSTLESDVKSAKEKEDAKEKDKTKPEFPEEYLNFFNPDSLQEIEIQFTQATWDKLVASEEHTGDYVSTTLNYKGSNADLTMNNVGIRIRGNTTWELPGDSTGPNYRSHFKLSFNETFDLNETNPEYVERKDRRLFNLRALNLKSERDDTTIIREQHAYNFMNKQGIFTPRSGAAHFIIKIDNKSYDMGVYTTIEPIDKSFLTRRYGKDRNDGNLYKCLWQGGGPATLEYNDISGKIGVRDRTTGNRPSYDRKSNESDKNYNDLIDFSKQLNDLSGNLLKQYIENNFAVDRFLKWIATNQLLGMPDDYWGNANNYYLYFPNNRNIDKIEFIPYDYDHGFGRGWDAFDTANANINEWWVNGGSAPLVTKLLAIDEYKTTYHNYLKSMIDTDKGDFTLAKYQAYFNSKLAKYKAAHDGCDLKEGTEDYSSMASDSVQEDWITERIDSVKQQLELIPPPVNVDFSVNFSDGFETEGDNIFAGLPGSTSFTINITTADESVVKTTAYINYHTKDGGKVKSKEHECLTKPFDITFNDTHAFDWWIIDVSLYNADSKKVGTEKYVVFTYNKASYQSVVDNGNGTYTFIFKPDELCYDLDKNDIKFVAVPGEFNGWNYTEGNAMTYDAGNGYYTQTISASSGQNYKFYVSFNDDSHAWIRDRFNKKMQTSDDFNSITP